MSGGRRSRLMGLVHLAPGPLKRMARALLPAKTAEELHRRAARADYVPWMVSRESAFKRAADRMLGRKPRLFRLVVHITDHCNLNCKGCSHFSNISPEWFAEPAELAEDFRHLAAVFSGITEIFLLGGEPLLHPRVDEFLGAARSAFPRSRINLLTNGLLVPKMPDSFWRAMRDHRIHLVCNRYPIRLQTERIEALSAQWSVEIEWWDARGEFFKLPIDPTGSQDATDSFQRCGTVDNCVTLRGHRLYPCAYAAYGDIFGDKFGLPGLAPERDDSVAIDGSCGPWEVFDFLCRPIPWCRYCDIDHISTYEWTTSRGDVGDWTRTDSEAETAERG